MSKYINADELLAVTDRLIVPEAAEAMKDIANSIPAADVEAVIRCKDCKWFDIDGIHGRPLDGHEVCDCKKFYGYPMRDDEYCSRAERRESEC